MKQTKSYTIKKLTGIEQYVVRRSGWCASIFLNNDTGEVVVTQGYSNNYDYCWSSPGRGDRSLKEFLISASVPYVMEKFSYGRDKWLDSDKTVEKIKAEIAEKHKSGEIPDGKFSRIMGEIEDMLGDDFKTTSEMYDHICQCDELNNEYDCDPTLIPWVTDYHPQLRGFMEKIWPEFIETLKQELDDAVPADLIKQLREATGCGMQEAAAALRQRNHDLELAREYVERSSLAAVMTFEARYPKYSEHLRAKRGS